MLHRSSLLLISALLFLLPPYTGTHDAPLVSVPGAQYLFGLSASPVGRTILLFSARQVPEGEASYGIATLVRLEAPTPVARQLRIPESQDDFTLPVWTSAGDKAYFLTTKGLYAMSVSTMRPKILVRGALAGLALSPDNTKLAFWDLSPEEEFHYDLQIFDLTTGKTIQKWSLETLYSADRYGFEIAFLPTGQSILARTYDTEGRTPLKKFPIAGGVVETISEDCTGLVASDDAIYFVTAGETTRALMRISADGRKASEVLKDFPYGGLQASSSRRWIVARDLGARELAILDSHSGKLTNLGRQCQAATVLANGDVIVAARGSLYSPVEGCR